MRRVTLQVMFLLLVSKILGFGRELVLSYFYGAGTTSDAYLTAINIPTLVFSTIISAIAFVFIPQYTRVKNVEGSESALVFTKRVKTLVVLLAVVLGIVITIFAPQTVRIFALGFTGEKFDLTVLMLRITVWSMIFIGLVQVLSSFTQAEERFLPSNGSTIPGNIILIISIALSATTELGFWALPIGFVISKIAETLVIVPTARKLGYERGLDFQLSDERIRTILVLALPIFVATSVDQINFFVDRTIASTISNGAVSIITYASLIKTLFEGIVVTAVISVTFPRLAQMAFAKDTEGLVTSFQRTSNVLTALMVPIAALTAVLAVPLVEVIYLRGAFTEADVAVTAAALTCFTLGLIGTGIRLLCIRTYYAMEDTITPLKNGLVAVVVNIVLNLILSRVMGVPGLALASSIAMLVAAVLLLRSLKRMMTLDTSTLVITLVKALVAAAIGAVVAGFIYWSVQDVMATIAGLLVSGIAGLIVYAVLAIVLRIEIVVEAWDDVRSTFSSSR